MKRLLAKTLLGTMLGVMTMGAAQARGIRVDFDPSSFLNQGAGWTFVTPLYVEGGPIAQSLAFSSSVNEAGNDIDQDGNASEAYTYTGSALKVGAVSYTSICANEDGFLQFSTGVCGASATDPIFAPFARDLNPLDATDPANSEFSPGVLTLGIGFSSPTIATHPIGSAPYDLDAGALPTLRFMWNQVADQANGDPYTFGAYFYIRGGGDFDVEFAYGATFSGVSYAASLASQYISADGSDLFRGDGATPYSTSSPYYYSFRNGALVGGSTQPPTGVPEPATLTLLGIGLLAMAAARRLRRRTR